MRTVSAWMMSSWAEIEIRRPPLSTYCRSASRATSENVKPRRSAMSPSASNVRRSTRRENIVVVDFGRAGTTASVTQSAGVPISARSSGVRSAYSSVMSSILEGMSVVPIRPRTGFDCLPEIRSLRVPRSEGIPLARSNLSRDDRDPAATVGDANQHPRVGLSVRVAPGGEAVVPDLERFATRDDRATGGPPGGSRTRRWSPGHRTAAHPECITNAIRASKVVGSRHGRAALTPSGCLHRRPSASGYAVTSSAGRPPGPAASNSPGVGCSGSVRPFDGVPPHAPRPKGRAAASASRAKRVRRRQPSSAWPQAPRTGRDRRLNRVRRPTGLRAAQDPVGGFLPPERVVWAGGGRARGDPPARRASKPS